MSFKTFAQRLAEGQDFMAGNTVAIYDETNPDDKESSEKGDKGRKDDCSDMTPLELFQHAVQILSSKSVKDLVGDLEDEELDEFHEAVEHIKDALDKVGTDVKNKSGKDDLEENEDDLFEAKGVLYTRLQGKDFDPRKAIVGFDRQQKGTVKVTFDGEVLDARKEGAALDLWADILEDELGYDLWSGEWLPAGNLANRVNGYEDMFTAAAVGDAGVQAKLKAEGYVGVRLRETMEQHTDVMIALIPGVGKLADESVNEASGDEAIIDTLKDVAREYTNAFKVEHRKEGNNLVVTFKFDDTPSAADFANELRGARNTESFPFEIGSVGYDNTYTKIVVPLAGLGEGESDTLAAFMRR